MAFHTPVHSGIKNFHSHTSIDIYAGINSVPTRLKISAALIPF